MAVNLFVLVQAGERLDADGLERLVKQVNENHADTDEDKGDGSFDWCDLYRGDESPVVMTVQEARAVDNDTVPYLLLDDKHLHEVNGNREHYNRLLDKARQDEMTRVVFMKART